LLVEEGWREATGWWGLNRRRTTLRDTVASCPPPREGQGQRNTLPSSSRRGGAKRRGGGLKRRRTTLRDTVASCPPQRGGQGQTQHTPLLVEEGWREATGWWVRSTSQRATPALHRPGI